ncbi:hypothetical protein KIPB_001037 [Kipferlia bialata]|uniref:Uncharacterized protein n=1 Tax=Kipferlia bialata TaxID=797122 RepID=A0A9K3GDX4_9EUKA|nr:hypothetical protein KIPB_001037 [Kipferlia bialata]|eukprot:g1037.t1
MRRENSMSAEMKAERRREQETREREIEERKRYIGDITLCVSRILQICQEYVGERESEGDAVMVGPTLIAAIHHWAYFSSGRINLTVFLRALTLHTSFITVTPSSVDPDSLTTTLTWLEDQKTSSFGQSGWVRAPFNDTEGEREQIQAASDYVDMCVREGEMLLRQREGEARVEAGDYQHILHEVSVRSLLRGTDITEHLVGRMCCADWMVGVVQRVEGRDKARPRGAPLDHDSAHSLWVELSDIVSGECTSLARDLMSTRDAMLSVMSEHDIQDPYTLVGRDSGLWSSAGRRLDYGASVATEQLGGFLLVGYPAAPTCKMRSVLGCEERHCGYIAAQGTIVTRALCHCAGIVYAFTYSRTLTDESDSGEEYPDSEGEEAYEYHMEVHYLNLAKEEDRVASSGRTVGCVWESLSVPKLLKQTRGVVWARGTGDGDMECVVDCTAGEDTDCEPEYRMVRLVPTVSRNPSLLRNRGPLPEVEDITLSVSALPIDQWCPPIGSASVRLADQSDYTVWLRDGMLVGRDMVSGDIKALGRVRGPLDTCILADVHNDPDRALPHTVDIYHARVCALPDGRLLCHDKVLGGIYLVDTSV